MLHAGAHAVRDAILEVHRVQPRTGAIVGGRRVHECAVVEQRGMRHTRVVARDALRLPAGRRDSPDVHLVRREPGREIKEASVGRPGEMMVVHAGLRDVDAPCVTSIAVGHIDWIARGGLVVRHLRSVGRPHRHHGGAQEGTRRSAGRRYQ